MHGHSAGDAVLQGVADALRLCVRTTDTLCRIGGEEFLIVLPCQTIQEADICAQRCRVAVAEREFEFNGSVVRTTISAGIASRRPDMVHATDLLKEADSALYAAKHAGRNRVHSSRIESMPTTASLPAA